MYQAGIEWILGFRLRGTELELEPCIPATWPGYEIRFRYHTTTYEIVVDNPHAVSGGILSAELDGQLLADGARVALHDDGATHRLKVVLGSASRTAA
jgi:cyclic beta-1,2-glucan synthetase